PKGLGKTSVARILAHEINSLPYTGETPHLDIIEIDAASNRRIDEIRDLRDKVHLAPTSAEYKVYIIDEVHMLTREAFNALLKTLEEPPAHVIFILATTEAHKLPETIISRTQRYNFKAVARETVAGHLANIAKKEGIKIDGLALNLLAQFGDGSFRDSISLLDQLGSAGKAIDEQMVRDHLGLPKTEVVEKLLRASLGGQPAQTLALLDDLRAQAIDPAGTAKLLAQSVRQKLASGEGGQELFNLLKELASVGYSPNPAEQLELALLESAARETGSKPEINHQEIGTSIDDEPKARNKAKETPPHIKPEHHRADIELGAEPKPAVSVAAGGPKHAKTFELSQWEEVLDKVKQTAPSIYTALRLALPSLQSSTLTLAFEFPLHQKKLNQAKNKDVVARAIEDISGQKLEIECLVDKELFDKDQPDLPKVSVPAPETEELGLISSIFGAAEVLES
ncbi:MAG TPA: DNA polymerase III subunit gamma/tau, partial [Candidatus Saccharimonadales bacterium]|nr:DNA polymerase III subunit gamma/tau [Candidatus Saccharimonadales bacterium]